MKINVNTKSRNVINKGVSFIALRTSYLETYNIQFEQKGGTWATYDSDIGSPPYKLSLLEGTYT